MVQLESPGSEPETPRPTEPSDPAHGRSAVPESGKPPVSRRSFFGGAAAGAVVGAGLVGAGVAGRSLLGGSNADAASGSSGSGTSGDAVAAADAVHPFYGTHQGGIDTPPQDHLVFLSLDLTTKDPVQLQIMLAKWSAAIAQMTQGNPLGSVEPHRGQAVPVDTGEAYGMGPQGLTVTIGFGPSMFDHRFGWAPFKPAALEDLPAMAGESLQPGRTGGDICIQACANDPQVAYHAARNLGRIARGQAMTRWTVLGFGRASAGAHQSTPRNLLGFKDGTRNIVDAQDFAKWVWVPDGSDQDWMTGGTYLVARKIHMLIETWDTDYIADQQHIFGRAKAEGAPLTGTREHDTPDFAAKAADGQPVINAHAHIALAAHENNDGVKILRRSYNFTEGLDDVGRLDAGLMFLSFQKDPAQFVSLQEKLGRSDLLNEYIRHVGSALFAVPPGLAAPGDYYGKSFFG